MKEQIKIEKKVNKKKLIAVYIAGGLLLIYLIYIIYLLIKQPTNVFTVEEGKLYQEETDVGYVIRNEKVVEGKNYKNGMEQIIAEGEKAATNENIFRYYSSNEESLKQKTAVTIMLPPLFFCLDKNLGHRRNAAPFKTDSVFIYIFIISYLQINFKIH